MLYDKKWDRQVDVHSIDNLIEWLERQDPTEPYCYLSHGRCLLGQYYAAMGFKKPCVYSNGWFAYGPNQCQVIEYYPNEFNHIALHNHTFGGALAAAKEFKLKKEKFNALQ